jgi:hypothetical protein
VQSFNAHEMSPKDTKFASLDELNQDLSPNQQCGRSKLAGIFYACYLATPSTHLPSGNPRRRHPPRLRRDKDECRRHSRVVPRRRLRDECAHGPAERGPVAGSHQHALLRHCDGEARGVSLFPCDARAGERASVERGTGGAVDEVNEGVGQGEGWEGQCGQGVSVEGLLRRLDIGEVDMSDW